MKNTEILIPINEVEFWQKLRELIRIEIEKVKNDATEYKVEGLTQKPRYKAKEVCSMLQISRQTLHAWVKDGVLKAYKIKSRLFFLWSDIEALILKDATN